jgi:MYXO-CTERM domain-containing protein
MNRARARALALTAVATAAVSLAPATAAADCASSCGDVCYAAEASAFLRVEAISTTGFSSRVRVVERLGGDVTVGPAIGEELEDVYSQVEVVAGDHVFVTISRFSDRPDEYVAGVAWPIRNGNVVCDPYDPEVPLDQYVAMATSDDCAAISEQLEIANTCDDTFDGSGCSSTGASTGASGGASTGALVLLGLAFVRRRRLGARSR